MRVRAFLLALFVTALSWNAGLGLNVQAGQVPSLDKIIQMEKQLIQSRRNIPSGRVVVVVRYSAFAPDAQFLNLSRRYVVYFQGDKMRADEEVATLAGQQLEQNRFVSTRDTFIRDVSSAE